MINAKRLNPIKRVVQIFFGLFGFGILRLDEIDKLRGIADADPLFDLEFLASYSEDVAGKMLHLLKDSKSQLRQDLFVAEENNFKTNGFFVEFGATNGFDLSNSYLLEMKFNWRGILAEPAKVWMRDLQKNRPNSSLESRCVWSKSGVQIEFNETLSPELSTVDTYSSQDLHSEHRISGIRYSVETISLLDLLRQHNAPKHIDYMSVDTEGTEYEILSGFDFGAYTFGVITCEHNGSENREKVFQLLSAKGYLRVKEEISRFDDWYIYSGRVLD